MTIEDDMLRWLQGEGWKATKFVRYEEDEYNYVSCGEGTCWDSEIRVKIFFIDENGKENYDFYIGELSDFIKELTS